MQRHCCAKNARVRSFARWVTVNGIGLKLFPLPVAGRGGRQGLGPVAMPGFDPRRPGSRSRTEQVYWTCTVSGTFFMPTRPTRALPRALHRHFQPPFGAVSRADELRYPRRVIGPAWPAVQVPNRRPDLHQPLHIPLIAL